MLGALNQPVDIGRLGDYVAGLRVRALAALGACLPRWIWEDEVEIQLRLTSPLDKTSPIDVQPYVNGAPRPALAIESSELATVCQQLFAEHASRRGTEKRITLILPDGRYLRKSLRLPGSARRNLREAGELQIEVETPFLPRDVYFSVLAQKAQQNSEGIITELAVAKRETVDGFIQRLRECGIDISAVAAPAQQPHSSQHGFDAIRPTVRSPFPKVAAAVFASALLVALATVILLPLQLHDAIAIREEEKSAEIVAEAGKITAAVEKAAGAEALLLTAVNEKQKGNGLLPLIDALSDTIPADSFIEHLSYRNDQLQLSGFTPSTSSLIDQLSKVSQLTSPSYLAPVSHQNGNGEHFDLSFHLAAPATK